MQYTDSLGIRVRKSVLKLYSLEKWVALPAFFRQQINFFPIGLTMIFFPFFSFMSMQMLGCIVVHIIIIILNCWVGMMSPLHITIHKPVTRNESFCTNFFFFRPLNCIGRNDILITSFDLCTFYICIWHSVKYLRTNNLRNSSFS